MTTQIEYSRWSPTQLAVSGISAEPRILINRLMQVRGTTVEFRNFYAGAFTVSYPSRQQREVERAIREVERAAP